MKIRIDLNDTPNIECARKCNTTQRKLITENDVCTKVNSSIDNLPIRCVGQWGLEKIYLLVQYFGIFAIGMKNNWRLNYIEICSGPGRCMNREIGVEFDGTAISIVQGKAFNSIEKALFFDFDSNVVETLNKRLKKLNVLKAKAILGDYTEPSDLCQAIKNELNRKSLNLCFIDPTDCSVPFILIKEIKETLPNVDFIINLASGTDFNRNIGNVILNDNQNLKLKYSKFLGTNDFFSDTRNIENAKNGNYSELKRSFRYYYTESLKNLGYSYFSFHGIKHFYDILFASSHKKGIEFWHKATRIKFDGQRRLF